MIAQSSKWLHETPASDIDKEDSEFNISREVT